MGCGNVTTSDPENIEQKSSLKKILNQPYPAQSEKRQRAKDKMRQEMKEYQKLIKRKRKN